MIELPKLFRQLLDGSEFEGPTQTLMASIGEILKAEDLPFFPDYAHGAEQIASVLKSEVKLVPEHVWNGSEEQPERDSLGSVDAAVTIAGTALHDLALHLRPAGLLELVSEDSRFKPLPWFDADHEGHAADRPWSELFHDFLSEARRLSQRELGRIIGSESARTWNFDKLPDDCERWERNDFLVLGEFIRRHHSRLAHEIAIYGFPGLPAGEAPGQFPAMGSTPGHLFETLADLIGLLARSRGTTLRICHAYLEESSRYVDALRPKGSSALYLMALLRIADYLQIVDHDKCPPAVLLHLREPQDPASVCEWWEGRAVAWVASDESHRREVVVSAEVGFSTCLQLRELLEDLQSELDRSSAVLSEVYAASSDSGLQRLTLAIRRVSSNLDEPGFLDGLPFLSERTGYSVDPNLLSLLVEPLYGQQPSVGIRELMQNSLDAVGELEAWCAKRGRSLESIDLPDQAADVLIDYIERKDGSWFVRVSDKGIGMTASTIRDYFLRAGVSFRRSAEWADEFLDEKGKPRTVRTGRFGIGAFAIFLLGPSFKLWTRHAGNEEHEGHVIEGAADSSQIKIERHQDRLPVGTTIEVELSEETIDRFDFRWGGPNTDWFCARRPRVLQRIRGQDESRTLAQSYCGRWQESPLPPQWSVFYPPKLGAVYWTFFGPNLICNGLRVGRPVGDEVGSAEFDWPFAILNTMIPAVVVVDSCGNLPLTTQRYAPSQDKAPFEAALVRDVALSVIAQALIKMRTPEQALALQGGHPLRRHLFYESRGSLRSCVSRSAVVLADPWLYGLLEVETSVVYGIVGTTDFEKLDEVLHSLWSCATHADYAISNWSKIGSSGRTSTMTAGGQLRSLPAHSLPSLGLKRISAARGILSIMGSDIPDGYKRCTSGDEGEPWRRFSVSSDEPMDLPTPYVEALLSCLERHWHGNETAIFVGVFRSIPEPSEPESLIAKIWDECLGPNPLPFDPEERESLIRTARQHPELARHIDSWERMKDSDISWEH